jgi:uncharacterized cupin superfamily protein
MPKIDHAKAVLRRGTGYPRPFDQPCLTRTNLRLGDAGGLTQFGVNITTLQPGGWASQRHWHSKEDEFVYMLEGELVLIEEESETILKAGDSAAWKAGVANGHHLVNRSAATAQFIVVGGRDERDICEYPDIDLRLFGEEAGGPPGGGFTHKDGTR